MEDMGVLDKIKGFMFNPTETFKKFREETLGDSFRYFVILLSIYSLLSSVMITVLWSTVWGFMYSGYKFVPGFEALYGSGLGIIVVIVLFVISFISGLIGIFIGGGIVHLGVLLFGGKRGYSETVKALIYGGTPAYLFGWVPFLVIIFAIWALILEIFGIRELQDLSTGRAIAAVLVPIIIIFVIVTVIIAMTVYVYVSGMMGGTMPKSTGLL